MNLNIFKMSMLQNRKSFIAWLITLPALVVLGMAFYPAISESMSDLVGLFENPMMKGLLGLFAMGPDQLSSLSGFYITYASIYVILMGGIFASLSAISDVAGELRDKTAEFLLTRPVSRKTILLSKWIAVETRLFIVTAVLCVVTLVSFMAFSKNAPLGYYEDEQAMEHIISMIEKSPADIQRVWELDDDFFTGWMMSMISTAMDSEAQALEELDVTEADMAELMSRVESDPEALFDDLLDAPEDYMAMFGIPESERDAFLKGVEERRSEFEVIRNRFASDPSFHLEMLEMSPEYFFREINAPVSRERFESIFPDASSEIRLVASAYSAERVVMLHTYIFLFMTVISSMSMVISVSIKQAKNAVSVGIGAVLVLYFISTLMKVSPVTAAYSWISPFGLIDQGITGGAYAFNPFNLSLLLIESAVFLLASLIIFDRRDI